MPAKPAYDLMVLIDPDAPEDRRAGIIDELRKQISASGELKGDADWGLRKLTFEIDHRTEAHYHLFQLEGPPDLLSQIDRALRINDAVLRHRIIKLPKGAPEETPRAPSAGRPESREERSGGDRPTRSEPERPAEVAPAEIAPAEVAPAEAAPEQAAAPEEAPESAPPPTSAEPEQQPA